MSDKHIMKKSTFLALTILALSYTSAYAATTTAKAAPKAAVKASAKPTPKIINLHYCPMTMEKVANNGKGGIVVGNYRVQMCCSGCSGEFNKLSTAEKKAVVEKIAKKEAVTK